MAIIKAGTYRFKDTITDPLTEYIENINFSVAGDVLNANFEPGATTTLTTMCCVYHDGVFGLCYGTGTTLLYNLFPVCVPDIEYALGVSNAKPWDTIALLFGSDSPVIALRARGWGQSFTVLEDADVSDGFKEWFDINIDIPQAHVYYNDSVIATLYSGTDATLKCASKAMNSDLLVKLNPEFNLEATKYTGEYNVYSTSEGLEFQLTPDENGYEVVGMGECEDEYLIIPSEHLGLPVVSVGAQAFKQNMKIKYVFMPESVTSIGASAFYSCAKLYHVDCSASLIENIAYSSFENCKNLIDIAFSNSLKSVEDCAFADCVNLNSITLGESTETLGSSTFSGCKNLRSIELGDSLKTIGGSAFNGCSGLTSIQFPDTITAIGGSAFKSCSQIREITLPPLLTSLPQAVFAHCDNLEKMVMRDNIKAIWRTAFYGCDKLSEIRMSESIEHIHGKAFGNCPSLINLSMPDSIRYTVGDPDSSSGNLFEGTHNLQFNVKDGCKYLGNDNNPYALLFKSTGGTAIQPGTKCIGGYAFKNVSMSSITIPNSVCGISQCAFGSCGLTSITLPSSIEYLDEYAFCKSVEYVSGTNQVGSWVDNDSIKDIYVPWAEGAIPGAPWGAANATIHYNSEV